ncbi:aminotransferase IV [Thermosipho melanesiensis]|uniref:Aminotransferase, class IV n=2 Tax=Thermosipho melanesiensis TaxID=46541 RepID=A6LKT6_THEM4|nr:aminotransferase class IV [Thermosipho melanesiensis]ABR30537.1 aminotransferase, class IV [Thermosipho melanesiensis BI429]APT73686.1 aminotransferase IV [Thermosipho melanesiensis]OOC35625.1 aminotransferase IV [Thermosipho melanesiensis]OOC39300.1 aminotransferase IV [Thermosipho melanesiensis]OOC39386.1 aminotransferase IV [Thermosipho melanesiensis]
MIERSLINDILNGIVVYETLRVYNGRPFALDEHFKRFSKSLSYVGEKVSYKEFLDEIERHLDFDRIKIYGIVNNGVKLYSIGENIEKSSTFSVRVDISDIRHADPFSIPPSFKALGRADLFLARKNKGENYDVILLNEKGFVCEGSFSNVFFIKNNVIYTPSLETGVLDGITRKNVIEMLKNMGYKVEEKMVELKELFYADEIFLTHTSRGIVSVEFLGKYRLETRISKLLSKKFEEFVNEKISGSF